MLSIFRIGSKPVLVIISFLMVTFFSSCSDRSESELAVFKALDESLVNSTLTINKSTETTLALMQQKQYDPTTTHRANIWQPKAILIQKLTTDIYVYIENIKSRMIKKAIENNSAVVMQLNDQLIKYKRGLIAIDSQMTEVFKNTVFFTPSFDSVDNKHQNINKIFFENTPLIAAQAMLSRLQNNIKISENKMVDFCNNQVGSFIEYYSSYSAIVAQSKSYVRAGEEIEITSGVGYFSSREAQPEITVNGTKAEINENGVAVYKFKASTKAGKHIVPVKINFTDQYRNIQLVTKDVEYSVVKD